MPGAKGLRGGAHEVLAPLRPPAAARGAMSRKLAHDRLKPPTSRCDEKMARGAAGGVPQVQPHRAIRNFADTAFWAATSPPTDGVAASISTCRKTSPAGRSKPGRWAWAPSRRRRRGSHHQEEPARPPAGPAVLRRERRSRPLGQRSQLSDEPARTSRSILELDGGTLSPMTPTEQTVEIAANGEQRVDWRVKVDQRRRGHRPHEGPHRRRIRRHGNEVPGLRPRHAQDGIVLRRDPPRQGRSGTVTFTVPDRAADQRQPRWKSAIRRRWPGPWSMRCRTWSTIPTAAPSRRSTASCRRSSRRRFCST